jgi:DNA-binding transcriptional LysR family regulator
MYDAPMDLRRLRYFVVATEELNFTRAAERLRIAQPPLSGHIKQLENEFGFLLFDRRGRGVRLTDTGNVLLEQARRIFIQLEQTVRMVARVGSGKVEPIPKSRRADSNCRHALITSELFHR